MDHVANAIARIPEALRDKPRFRALIEIIVGPVQELEVALQALLLLRSVDTAIGAQLDDIGAKVGQARGTITDDELYRRYIRARIATNRSNGNVEDLIKVARLVLADTDARIVVSQPGVAAVVMRVEDVATDADVADALIALLRSAKAAGVRIILESSTVDPDETYTLDEPAGSARGYPEGISVAVDSTFTVFREDVSLDNEPVTVPAGEYSHAEMIALIDGQILGTMTFTIVAGVAEFEYLADLLSVNWGAATGLRDALGFTGNAVAWNSTTFGPFTAPNPVDDSGVGGTLSDART